MTALMLGTVREQIMEAALKDLPMEACGFVLDSGAVVHCSNVDPVPYYRFRMDPVEAASWWGTGRVSAVWHSHPTGPAAPSEDDIETAPVGIRYLVYSVEEEDLATYERGDLTGQLYLVEMESPE